MDKLAFFKYCEMNMSLKHDVSIMTNDSCWQVSRVQFYIVPYSNFNTHLTVMFNFMIGTITDYHYVHTIKITYITWKNHLH